MTSECMLTTVDNPYDPFDQFILWFMFDIEHNYNTCGRLMREAKVSDDMSQKEEDEEVDRAIDKIIELDPLNLYTKATRQVANT